VCVLCIKQTSVKYREESLSWTPIRERTVLICNICINRKLSLFILNLYLSRIYYFRLYIHSFFLSFSQMMRSYFVSFFFCLFVLIIIVFISSIREIRQKILYSLKTNKYVTIMCQTRTNWIFKSYWLKGLSFNRIYALKKY